MLQDVILVGIADTPSVNNRFGNHVFEATPDTVGRSRLRTSVDQVQTATYSEKALSLLGNK